MALIKIRLGEYIEPYSEKCNISKLSNDDISGINKEKEFFEPSKQVGKDTSNYKIVPPGYFACNLMHVGRDVVLPIAYNHFSKNKIVSPAYQVFKFSDNNKILSEYFFLFLKSPERDRYFWFNTDGSIRDGMSWTDFINIEIELPPLSIQKKYVNIYKLLLENQEKYEQDLDDLKLVCDAYIEKLKREMPSEPIGPYITRCDRRNGINGTKNVKGLSTKKEFRPAQSRVDINKLEKYKVVEHNDFVFVPTTDTWKVLAFAYNTESYPVVVSPIYEVFSVDTKVILPGYLALWLKRKDFDRYARFHSWGSARENFTFENMCDVKIPIPSIKIQQDIVNIYDVCNLRKEINEKLKEQIKSICPILIKGAVEEAQKEA